MSEQATLGEFHGRRGGLDALTDAEREVYLAVQQGDTDVDAQVRAHRAMLKERWWRPVPPVFVTGESTQPAASQ